VLILLFALEISIYYRKIRAHISIISAHSLYSIPLVLISYLNSKSLILPLKAKLPMKFNKFVLRLEVQIRIKLYACFSNICVQEYFVV
jgi:hypothetical protein